MKSGVLQSKERQRILTVLRENPVKVLIALALFFSTFGAGNASIDAFGFKVSLFRLIVMALFAIMVFRFIRGRDFARAFSGSAWWSLCFLVIFVGYAALSGLWAHDYAKWIRHVYFLFLCLVLAISMCVELKSPKNFRIVAYAFIISCLIQALLGVYELISHNYLFAPKELFDIMESRNVWYPIALGGGINGLAAILSAGVAYCVIVHKLLEGDEGTGAEGVDMRKRTVYRYAIVVVGLFFVVVAYMSKSRACLFSIIAVGLVLILCSKHRKKLLIVAVACLVVILIVFFDQVVGLLGVNLEAAEGSSDSIRVNLIANGLDALKSTLGFGVGAGQVDYWIETHEAFNVAGIYQMHNMWAEVLVTYGVLIWVGFIAFFAKLCIDCIKAIRNGKSPQAIRLGSVGFLSLLAVIAIANLALGSFVTKEWLMCSLALCVAWQSAIASSDEGIALQEEHDEDMSQV